MGDGSVREGVPFAHPSLSDLIYRAAFAQSLPLERGRYDPMPLPLVALAATAVSTHLVILYFPNLFKDLCRPR
jgi:hypothetical protein